MLRLLCILFMLFAGIPAFAQGGLMIIIGIIDGNHLAQLFAAIHLQTIS